MFPTLNEFIEDTEDMRLDGDVKLKIINNLQSLRSEFTKYFPETTRDDLVFVRNPYLVPNSEVVNMFNGDVSTQEEFIALKNDSTAEDAFKEKSLPAYWSAMQGRRNRPPNPPGRGGPRPGQGPRPLNTNQRPIFKFRR